MTIYCFLRSRLALMCTCFLLMSTTLSAQFYFNETCRNATGVFIPGGNAPGYTANGMGDAPGNGWLRLTNCIGNQVGFVKFQNTFPSTMGVTIEFDFKVWHNTSGDLADGFSIFLFDGAYFSSFVIGAYGGALGYSTNPDAGLPGMPHAYVGVGIDEYGNFANHGPNTSPIPTSRPNSIGIRDGNFYWIAGTPSNLGMNIPLGFTPVTSVRPADNLYYRRVRIDILPNGAGNMTIDVYLRTSPSAAWQQILNNVLITNPVPELFGMGFASSTGGSMAFHEVRDLIARTPGDLYVYMPEMPCLNINPNDTTTIPIHIVNGLGPCDSLLVCDTLPQCFNLLEPPTATTTNGTVTIMDFTQTTMPDGRLLCCYMLNMSSYGEVVMNYIGNFDASTHPQSFTVGSTITPPQGNYVDFDTTDNHFTITIPLIRLDTVTICHGESHTQGGNIYTESGDYMLVFQAVSGCDSIVYLHLTVSEAAYFNLVDTITLCHGDIGYLSTDYNLPNTFYYWNNGVTEPEIKVVAEGIYTLTILTWINDSTILCRHDDTVCVVSTPYPVADFDAYPVEGCTPFKTQMYNLTDLDNHVHSYDVTISYAWEVYDEWGRLHFISNEIEPEFEFTQQGNYTIKLIATTNMGCADTVIKYNFIHTIQQPHVEFMAIPETQFLSDDGIYFHNFTDTNTLTLPSTIWYWDFGDGTTDSTNYSPTHQYEEWGDYAVTFFMVNGLGCSDQISHLVSVEADFKFPNIITPNGDGLNDVFAIENLNTTINPDDPAQFRTNRLSIFNRWGRRVYDAENYDTFVKNGDITVGKKAFSGENLPDGTYYYTFYYKGKIRTINVNGTLIIVREAK